MAVTDLIHRAIIFNPELDLETAAELPGKSIATDLREALGTRGLTPSNLIQDSHGWCFKIRGEDARNYMVELTYVCTKPASSQWVLSCVRLAGLRVWEFFSAAARDAGLARKYLRAAGDILVTHHGFEVST